MDEQIAALKKLGIGVMQSGQRVGSRFAYMDTEKIVGVIGHKLPKTKLLLNITLVQKRI